MTQWLAFRIPNCPAFTATARLSTPQPTCANLSCCAPLPCSLKLRESKAKGGGLVVEGVSGNAAKSGIKTGDTIIYASSFFGDELWPADKLSFTQTAIQRAPSPVAFVYVSAVWDVAQDNRVAHYNQEWSNEGCGSGCCWWDV